MSRPAMVVGAAVLLVAAVFAVVALRWGARADSCTEELVSAVARKDAAYVDRAVRNPSVRDALFAAHAVELGFVRPMSSDWIRVGLFVKPAATSTVQQVVVLQLLEDAGEGCVFLRDYESGPFGGQR